MWLKTKIIQIPPAALRKCSSKNRSNVRDVTNAARAVAAVAAAASRSK